MSLAKQVDRPLLFFGGKGGVGKTTLAAATALGFADEGTRTLLVSTDPAHSTGDILGSRLGAEPTPVCESLWAMELDPAVEAADYIDGVKARIADAVPPRLAAEVERQVEVARVSPGAEEAALFERFARILDRADSYERIVFDTAPTGQTLRLLSLPEMMSAWIGGLVAQRRKVTSMGRMWRTVSGAAAVGDVADDPVLQTLEARRDLFHRARGLITDRDHTVFMFVTIPERLPVLETHRAMEALSRYEIPVGGLFVNQVLPDEPGGDFLRQRRTQQATHLAEIERRFGDWPVVRVPLLPADPVGLDGLRELAGSMSQPGSSTA